MTRPHAGGLARRPRTIQISIAVLLAPFRTRTAHVVELGPIAVAPALGPSATELYGCRHAGGEQNGVESRSGQQCDGVAHDDRPISLVVRLIPVTSWIPAARRAPAAPRWHACSFR